MRSISLYLHIPFCKRRCSYCTFYHVPQADDLEKLFVDAVVCELRAAAGEIGESFQCPTIFFGGGTPSVLGSESLDKIFEALSPHLPKRGTPEVTFETNPEDVTPALLQRLRDRGVNRLSLGIQSMDAGTLRVLKRCSARVNSRAVELVKGHFANFSLDLLLGSPYGSVGDVQGTLEHLLAYEPPHFSVYCLEAGGVLDSAVTEFFQRVDPERSAEEYLHVCETLARHAYVHYEISNFAKAGYESRHNRVYWEGGEYLGIGPGAHSYIAEERFYNEPSIERYVSAEGSLPKALRCAERRGHSQRRLEQRMLALRTARGLAGDQLPGTAPIIDELIEDDLAGVADNRLFLTDRGYLVLNEILLRLSKAA
jgi:oxygen-independent coproporphyrinogen-3 oxidase